MLRQGQQLSCSGKGQELGWLHAAHLCAFAWLILVEQFIFQKKILLLKDFWKISYRSLELPGGGGTHL